MEVLGAIIAVVGLLTLMVALPIILYNHSYKEVPKKTQWKISDKDLLLLINQQPDRFITPHLLAEQSELTLKEAKNRLNSLLVYRVLDVASTPGLKRYFNLREDLDLRHPPKLSDNPFLTKEDIMTLFKHHNFRLSLQQICIDTGLPVAVIAEELKRFVKEKIVVMVRDRFFKTTYLLKEPFRSEPESPLEDEEGFNLDLSKIYQKETLKNKS